MHISANDLDFSDVLFAVSSEEHCDLARRDLTCNMREWRSLIPAKK